MIIQVTMGVKRWECQALVAHAYNPSYSGDRNQEDLGFKASPEQIVHETK
jgi:hypothetical protein